MDGECGWSGFEPEFGARLLEVAIGGIPYGEKGNEAELEGRLDANADGSDEAPTLPEPGSGTLDDESVIFEGFVLISPFLSLSSPSSEISEYAGLFAGASTDPAASLEYGGKLPGGKDLSGAVNICDGDA